MGRVTTLGVIACTASVALSSSIHAQSSTAAAGPASAHHFIEATCIKCHNAEASSAMALFSGMYLDRVDVANIARDPIIWEKVVRKLRTGLMPPSSEPRPDAAAKAQFLTYIESELDRAAFAHPNPGRPALHRLNRTEYQNAIRDLLALDINASALLPADDSSLGFDNMAGALGVSPVLIERYSSAAAKVSRLAVGDRTAAAGQKSYYVDGLLAQADHIEGFPFGTRGGLRVEHFFPVSGEYVLGADLIGDDSGFIGQNSPNEQLEVSIDGQRVVLFNLEKPKAPAPPPAEEDEKAKPETKSAAAAKSAVAADKPIDQVAVQPEPPRQSEAELNARKKAARQEIRLPVMAGPHVIVATFIKKNHALVEDVFQPHENQLLDPLLDNAPDVVTVVPHMSSITVTGPYGATDAGDTPSRRKIFTCRPQSATTEAACAREILSGLATRAYRAPVDTEHLSVLMDFYAQGRQEGDFENGIELGLQRILASPQFMFRFEQDPAKPTELPYRISDLELASRLSFFLWSTIPDDQLLDLASRGRLSKPAVLKEQVQRMLADPRSSALVENFAGQWLQLRKLNVKGADTLLYPDYDDGLRNGFRRETEMMFDYIVHQDRSVLDLLNADYTFVNERLARHYGMAGIYGSQFRKVAVIDDNRRGLLGQGSILLATSQPSRTSPVTRGVWILENILGAHVPTPPMNVPPLEDAAKGVNLDTLSVRELMESHRSKPFCEGCHKIMDPVGLAMENFDVVGRWRTRDGDGPVDASTHLVDGTNINGPADLRRALLQYSDQVVRNITERLMMYALGRGLEYYDQPVVRSVAHQAAANDYRFSTLIMGIVMSEPFQMRAPEGLGVTTVANEH